MGMFRKTTPPPPPASTGIFSSSRNTPPPQQTSSGLFSRNSTSNRHSSTSPTTGTEKTGLFGNRRRRSSSSSSDRDRHSPVGSTATTGTGLAGGRMSHMFSKNDSLTAAHAKLTEAVHSERAADEALLRSRASVKEARSHVRTLELEAQQEARAAQEKVRTAGRFRKAADKLGKH